MTLPATRIDWPKYWDAQPQDPFASQEFLQSFQGIKRFIFRYVEKRSRVLVVGCGNSRLAEDIYDCGVHNITCMDCSESIIRLMKIRNRSEGRSKMQHIVMNYAELEFKKESFDIVIDKNVLDIMMSIPKDENKAALNCARQAHKVLKPGGVLLMLTYAQPSTRWPVIGWSEDPDFVYRFNAGLNWRLCEAFALPKESADPASADFEIEEDRCHYMLTCEKPGRGAKRLYKSQRVAIAKRVVAAVHGAAKFGGEDGDEDEEDMDLFG
eukprot:g3491.t1